jgi:hypothetical protein
VGTSNGHESNIAKTLSIGSPARVAQAWPSCSHYAAKGSNACIAVMVEPAQLFYNVVYSVVYVHTHDQGLTTHMMHVTSIIGTLKEHPLMEYWAAVHTATGCSCRKPPPRQDQSDRVPVSADEPHRIALEFFACRTKMEPTEAFTKREEDTKNMSCDAQHILSMYETKHC